MCRAERAERVRGGKGSGGEGEGPLVLLNIYVILTQTRILKVVAEICVVIDIQHSYATSSCNWEHFVEVLDTEPI